MLTCAFSFYINLLQGSIRGWLVSIFGMTKFKGLIYDNNLAKINKLCYSNFEKYLKTKNNSSLSYNEYDEKYNYKNIVGDDGDAF
jgi:hypothetical protein